MDKGQMNDGGFRPLGKYAPLAWHLKEAIGDECEMAFDDLETIIRSGLPKTARAKRTGWLWWNNDQSRTQAANGWLAAGWRVALVDYTEETVRFDRYARR